MRVVLLVFLITLIAKDLLERAKERAKEIPTLVMNIQAPPPPIVQEFPIRTRESGPPAPRVTVAASPPITNNAPGGFATSGGTLINPQVNNYGPKIPTLLGGEIIEKNWQGTPYATADNKGHPLTNVRFYADSAWDDPRIGVVCDRPCTAYQAQPFQTQVLISPTFLGASTPSQPNLVVFIFTTIKPMSADTYYVLTVASPDSNPVKILRVAPFVGKISQH
jgi:hypothetical protein